MFALFSRDSARRPKVILCGTLWYNYQCCGSVWGMYEAPGVCFAASSEVTDVLKIVLSLKPFVLTSFQMKGSEAWHKHMGKTQVWWEIRLQVYVRCKVICIGIKTMNKIFYIANHDTYRKVHQIPVSSVLRGRWKLGWHLRNACCWVASLPFLQGPPCCSGYWLPHLLYLFTLHKGF